MPNYKRQRVERVLFTSPSNPSVDLNDTATEKVLDQAALVATGAPVHQIWHPVGDDETSPQLGVEGQHELLLDHLPEDEVKTKTNYLARLKELQSQLATRGCERQASDSQPPANIQQTGAPFKQACICSL